MRRTTTTTRSKGRLPYRYDALPSWHVPAQDPVVDSGFDWQLLSLRRGIRRRQRQLKWAHYQGGSDGAAPATSGFGLDPAHVYPRGIAFGNGRCHVLRPDKVHAYDASGQCVPAADFGLGAENTRPTEITFGNGRFYVVDGLSYKVFPN